jgi:hypothetical protein
MCTHRTDLDSVALKLDHHGQAFPCWLFHPCLAVPPSPGGLAQPPRLAHTAKPSLAGSFTLAWPCHPLLAAAPRPSLLLLALSPLLGRATLSRRPCTASQACSHGQACSCWLFHPCLAVPPTSYGCSTAKPALVGSFTLAWPCHPLLTAAPRLSLLLLALSPLLGRAISLPTAAPRPSLLLLALSPLLGRASRR